MPAGDGPLVHLAGAILDGSAIDWTTADSTVDQLERMLLPEFRTIAALAEAHRRAEMVDADQWGHLQLRELVGRGAFGVVYRAWDTRLDREVALKLMPASSDSSSSPSSIIEEGRLLARVRHPNVVTIYGAERIGSWIGLWMEFIEGRTLQQLVADGKVFTADEVLSIGVQLCRAVAAVHDAGLLHRDIKAQNVMIASDGRVILMDFGTGREADAADEAPVAGTPLYFAPEMLLGHAAASVGTDLYSVGVVLFFLLTGSYPVTGASMAGLRQAHDRGDRTSLRHIRPEISHRLCGLIQRATDPDPNRRPSSAKTLEASLGALQQRHSPRLAAYVAAAAAIVVMVSFARTIGRAPPETHGTSSGSAGAEASASRVQIAVLPFVNQSTDRDSDYFVEGLTHDIIGSLAVIEGLDVRASTSSSAFKQQRPGLADVGERLGVAYVVEGSVLRAGNALRVDARLVQVDGEVTLWSDHFEHELTVANIFAIQRVISEAIVNQLRLTIGKRRHRADTNLEVYERYHRARGIAERRGVDNAITAIQLFNEVIAADPGFAPAHAGLVHAYAHLSMGPYQGGPFAKAHPVMRSAAIEALRLDPLLAEAHAATGWVSAREFDWTNAERSFRRAIELNRSLSFVYTNFSSSTLGPQGRLDEAAGILREAARIDPLSLDLQRELGAVLFQARRYPESIEILERILNVDADFPWTDYVRARALVQLGRYEEALPALERRRHRLLTAGSGVYPEVAFAYVKLGRRAEAKRLAEENDHLPYRRAMINAALGNTERMFSGLEQMLAEEPQRLAYTMRSPEFQPYADDERFRRLLGRMNLR